MSRPEDDRPEPDLVFNAEDAFESAGFGHVPLTDIPHRRLARFATASFLELAATIFRAVETNNTSLLAFLMGVAFVQADKAQREQPPNVTAMEVYNDMAATAMAALQRQAQG